MKKTIGIAALILAVGAVYGNAQAGEMEPPGPPAPTMKTLDEIKPGTPIHATDLPLTISQPGYYYLAENIETTGAGITISVDNVTIDLMGFTLRGGSGAGISANFNTSNTVVRNGTIADWSETGVVVDNYSLIEKVRSVRNRNGLSLGRISSAIDCIALDNEFAGIRITGSDGGVVRGCTVEGNGSHGVYGEYFLHVVDCVVRNNGGTGIVLDENGVVEGNVVWFNAAGGIELETGTIRRNDLWANGLFGISAYGCHIIDNTVQSHPSGPEITTWGGSRIVGNQVVGTIELTTSGSVIIQNTANAYLIAPGNDVGPIGTAATSTSPWANIQN